MGLDMYLTRKFYVKNWDHMGPDEKHQITITKGGKPSGIPTDRIREVETDEIYWRKANAIHRWFVDNCQGGVDDCRSAYVEREKLQELLDLVTRVIKSSKLKASMIRNGYTIDEKGKKKYRMVKGKVMTNTKLAKELLPTQSGFFFGDTEYDQYYYEDLVFTRDEIIRVLAEDAKAREDGLRTGDFYYHSSW